MGQTAIQTGLENLVGLYAPLPKTNWQMQMALGLREGAVLPREMLVERNIRTVGTELEDGSADIGWAVGADSDQNKTYYYSAQFHESSPP